MRDAVLVGVGGVGIGTALHDKIGPDGSVVGQVNQDKVREALHFRDAAAKETAGRAAQLLAELDWQFAEASLLEELHGLREQPYESLRNYLDTLDRNLAAEVLSRYSIDDIGRPNGWRRMFPRRGLDRLCTGCKSSEHAWSSFPVDGFASISIRLGARSSEQASWTPCF